MRTRKDLRKYQDGAVEFIKRVKRGALFIDPGLGKTTTTLTALSELIDDMELCGMTLVVAPPRVAKETWPREFAEWAQLQGRTFVYIAGTPDKRLQLLQRRADFHIISMENLPWLLRALGGSCPEYTKVIGGVVSVRDGTAYVDGVPAKVGSVVRQPNGDLLRVDADKVVKLKGAKVENLQPGDQIKVKGSGWRSPTTIAYDAIVVDESSKVKNQDTNRWKALKHLAFLVDYFLILTGTPAANSLHDLWAQIYLLDGGKRLGTTLTSFRERWFLENYNGHGYRAKDYAQKVIEDAIADITFTLREADYANLPPRMYNTIDIALDDSTLKKYREFERSYVLEVDDVTQIVANEGAALTQKLLQLANGVVYRTDPKTEEKTEHVFHNAKLDAMGDLVEELNGQNLLVAYQFKSDLARILRRFPQARVLDKKSETQDAWNRGEIPVLLVHPKSAAHGLNLQFGGNNVLWYGPTWSLEDYIQLNKRLHRSGQTKPVMVHHLIVKGSIDEDVMESLNGKNDVQETLLNLLKNRIESYK